MAFPWGAVIGGAGSLFGGIAAGRGMAAAGRYGQLAAKDQLEIGTMRQRESQKGIMAGGIDARISPYLNLPFQMEQERKAFEYMQGVGRDKKRAANIKDKERQLQFRAGTGFGEMKRRQMQRQFDTARGLSRFNPDALKYGQIAFRA
tara:strand:+ start:235 stop:675 length:441 start_codon:yes stop_codon:yes gene_type:complete